MRTLRATALILSTLAVVIGGATGASAGDVSARACDLGADRALCVGADLHERSLHHANLREAVLHHADLHGAVLHHASLRGAFLHYANLRGAILYHADLRGAILHHADLRGAILHHADLRGAILHHADLRGANFDHINTGTSARSWDMTTRVRPAHQQISCADPSVYTDSGPYRRSESPMFTCVNLPCVMADYLQGRLVNVGCFSTPTVTEIPDNGYANLNFDYANAAPVHLSRVNAQKSSWVNANLTGADMSGSDFTGAIFTRADLTGAILTGTILTGVTWDDATCPDGQKGPYPCA